MKYRQIKIYQYLDFIDILKILIKYRLNFDKNIGGHFNKNIKISVIWKLLKIYENTLKKIIK